MHKRIRKELWLAAMTGSRSAQGQPPVVDGHRRPAMPSNWMGMDCAEFMTDTCPVGRLMAYCIPFRAALSVCNGKMRVATAEQNLDAVVNAVQCKRCSRRGINRINLRSRKDAHVGSGQSDGGYAGRVRQCAVGIHSNWPCYSSNLIGELSSQQYYHSSDTGTLLRRAKD